MNKLGGFLNRVPAGIKAAVGVGTVSGAIFMISGYTGVDI